MSRATVLVFALAKLSTSGNLAKSLEDASAVTGSLVLWDSTVAIRTLNGLPSVESLISCKAVGSFLRAASTAFAASKMIRWIALCECRSSAALILLVFGLSGGRLVRLMDDL